MRADSFGASNLRQDDFVPFDKAALVADQYFHFLTANILSNGSQTSHGQNFPLFPKSLKVMNKDVWPMKNRSYRASQISIIIFMLFFNQECGSGYFSTASASTLIASASTNKKTINRPLTIFLYFVGL